MCERDFRDFRKRKLSASADGRGIRVGATASPGTLIHTALPNIAANEWDEVWLRAVNTSGSAVRLTIEWGGTSSPDDQIEVSIPPEGGFTPDDDGDDGHASRHQRGVRGRGAGFAGGAGGQQYRPHQR